MKIVDTHTHLDGEEFKEDLPQTIQRAKNVGVGAILIPCIDEASIVSVMEVCRVRDKQRCLEKVLAAFNHFISKGAENASR